MYTIYNPDTDTIKVSNNVLQGTESAGFAFPDIPCTASASIGFYDNEAGVCEEVCILFNHPEGLGCAYAGRAAAYHAQKCIMFSANTDGGVILEKVRTAECQIGITLRIGT